MSEAAATSFPLENQFCVNCAHSQSGAGRMRCVHPHVVQPVRDYQEGGTQIFMPNYKPHHEEFVPLTVVIVETHGRCDRWELAPWMTSWAESGE